MIKSNILRNVGIFARVFLSSVCLVFAISNAYSDDGKKEESSSKGQNRATKSRSVNSTQNSRFRSRVEAMTDNLTYDMPTQKRVDTTSFRPRTRAVSEGEPYDMSTRKNSGFRSRTRAVSEREITSEDLGPLLKGDDASDFWLDE